ncbi:MAG: DUF1217 domain-containing protein [Rhodospirillales bacterium]|nr:DUF1217 domain-containing protein [Rhodospirillales bacterium]
MSGSTYLLPLFQGSVTNSGNNSATSLLTAIEQGASGIGASAADPMSALRIAQRNQAQDIATTAAQPAVARDIAAFKQAVASARTPQDLLSNPTALKVLLTANGLGSEASYTALAQKVLLSNPSDPASLVNKVAATNASWLSVVKTYQFASKGLATLQNPSVQQTIANGYAEVKWRQSLDATTPGLSDALTFQSEAGTITSAGQVLADPVLFNVVTTALNIPQQIVFQDRSAQEQAINAQLDYSRLKNATYVNSITDQFLINSQQSSNGSTNLTSLAIQAQGLIA